MWMNIWLGAFKWATSHYHSLRGCKNVTCQSWNSEKNALCISLLFCKKGFENTRVRSFFRPPTLTGNSFVAPWAMMMKISSFESPKLYLLTLNSNNSKAVLLTIVRTSWKLPIYYINRVLMILNRTTQYLG